MYFWSCMWAGLSSYRYNVSSANYSQRCYRHFKPSSSILGYIQPFIKPGCLCFSIFRAYSQILRRKKWVILSLAESTFSFKKLFSTLFDTTLNEKKLFMTSTKLEWNIENYDKGHPSLRNKKLYIDRIRFFSTKLQSVKAWKNTLITTLKQHSLFQGWEFLSCDDHLQKETLCFPSSDAKIFSLHTNLRF